MLYLYIYPSIYLSMCSAVLEWNRQTRHVVACNT